MLLTLCLRHETARWHAHKKSRGCVSERCKACRQSLISEDRERHRKRFLRGTERWDEAMQHFTSVLDKEMQKFETAQGQRSEIKEANWSGLTTTTQGLQEVKSAEGEASTIENAHRSNLTAATQDLQQVKSTEDKKGDQSGLHEQCVCNREVLQDFKRDLDAMRSEIKEAHKTDVIATVGGLVLSAMHVVVAFYKAGLLHIPGVGLALAVSAAVVSVAAVNWQLHQIKQDFCKLQKRVARARSHSSSNMLTNAQQGQSAEL